MPRVSFVNYVKPGGPSHAITVAVGAYGLEGRRLARRFEVGQQVEAGQAVVVLEAMKMENQIAADKAGTVKEIKVTAGDTVGAGDVVVIIE